jgi:hypothetical protein
VIVMALQGDNIVAQVRDLLGPTDSRKAAKGTIRGDFGTEMMKNVVHASDSDENAKHGAGALLQAGRTLRLTAVLRFPDRKKPALWRAFFAGCDSATPNGGRVLRASPRGAPPRLRS